MKRIMKRMGALLLCCALLTAGFGAVPGTRAAAAGKKLIALTFDDGPGPYTDRLLDGLKAKGAHASFFTLGQRAELYPAQIKRIFSEGHQLCNHSYNHPQLTALSATEALNQVSATDRILNRLTGGSESHYLRAPYGSMGPALRSQLNCPEIYWSVDTLDWKYRDAGYVKNAVLDMAFDGAVVLMHDIHPTTVTGVLQALDTLKARGYEMVTVRELFRRRGVSISKGRMYYRCDSNGTDLGAAARPQVQFSPAAGGLRVTLTASAGAKIYYTLDGSDLGYGSRLYTGPFTVGSPCTLRAVAAYSLNGGRGPELSYGIHSIPASEATPGFDGTYLSFSGVPDGQVVAYTLDGSDPTWYGVPYTGPVALKPGTKVAFYTRGTGLKATPVRTLYYSPKGNLYADVSPEDWFCDPVDEAVSLGFLKGVGDFRFQPHGELTRGMAVSLLYRMSGETVSGARTNPFEDVRDGDYFADAVEWAYRRSIAAGVSEKAFAPGRPVTRQELCRLLVNALDTLSPSGWELSPEDSSLEETFTDWGQVDDWAKPHVAAAVDAGLLVGEKLDLFHPDGTATRAQGAAVLVRLDRLLKESAQSTDA